MHKKNLLRTFAITMVAANIISITPMAVFADNDTIQETDASETSSPTEEISLSSMQQDEAAVPSIVSAEEEPTEIEEVTETDSTESTVSTDSTAPTEESPPVVDPSPTEAPTEETTEKSKEEDTSESTSEDTDSTTEKETEDKTEEKPEEKKETDTSPAAPSKKEESDTEKKEDTIDTSKDSSSVPAVYEIHGSSKKSVRVTSISKENTPNAYSAAKLLVEKGFTKEAASGIVGNFFCESGGQGTCDIDPATDDGSAIGIAQWTGSGRKAFLTWCDNNNRQWDSIETQIDYLVSNITSRWSYSSSIGSVKTLTTYGLGDKLQLDLETFKTCTSLEEATLSFLGVYEDDLYARTARWAGFSSLNGWIEYEVANRLKCASDCYVAFFDGTALDDISYKSEDPRVSYTKVKKDGYIVRANDTSIYTDTDKEEVAGTASKYAIVYKLEEDGNWYYVESGDVRGYIEKSSLYSNSISKGLIEEIGGEAFSEATAEIALKENEALDHTQTTVYWFRDPSSEELVNFASDVAKESTDNASWISDICSFYNLNVDFSENFDKIGKEVEEIAAGTVVSYKDGEKTTFAIAKDDRSYITVDDKGEQVELKDIDVEAARDVFADTEYVETINDVPYYCQGDFADVRFNDGSVASDGCGITSFSMVASYFLDKQISPAQSAVWAMENNANTVKSWDSFKILADHYGITFEGQYKGPAWDGSAETIVKALKEGKLVIGSMEDGYFDQSGNGHYIVYTGIDSEGHIYINDPGSRERTTAGSYSQEDALSTCKQFWIFSK